ncbi:hypothetical protein DFH28DRAFT_951921 [Melampsora americana]|nr:hypothetical protein DFH28DRAFT_951921 [Melampsora americana]
MSDNCNAQDKSTGLKYTYTDICLPDCKDDPSPQTTSAAPITSTLPTTSAPPTSTTSSSSPPTSTVSADPEVPTRTCEKPALTPNKAPECAKKCARRTVQEGYCETESLFDQAYKQCLDNNCNPQDTKAALQFKYDDICPATCRSDPGTSTTSTAPTPMTSSDPNPTATTSSSLPVSTTACDPSSLVPARAPACVKKCAKIKVQEGYCTDERVFNKAYKQCLSDNCNGQDASTGLQYKFDNLCPAACRSDPSATSTSSPPTSTVSSDSPSPTTVCVAKIPDGSPACVNKCATIKVQEGYCSNQAVFNKAYAQCIRDNCEETDTDKGLEYKWDDICPIECTSTPPSSGVNPSPTGITSSGSNGTPSATSNSPVPTASNSDAGISPTSSSAGPSPTGDAGSGSGGLPPSTPPCARKCARIKVQEGYCYSSDVLMTAFYQCLSDNCAPNDAAKGRTLTYRQICGSAGISPTSSSPGPSPTGDAGSGSGNLPASTPQCARKCASFKVSEGYCSSSNVLMAALFKCLSDNCNPSDAALGRQLTYRQICGSTGPSSSSSSPGPSPTGDGGSSLGGLPSNTPPCVRKCATIKVREGYCSSSQIFMTAFFQCLSDNCNFNDVAKGRQLTHRQICGSTGPNPSTASAGPLPTGGTGSGTSGLPASAPSCVRKCATIKVREGYCYSSQIMMTAFFQCLSDNCNSNDAAKGRQFIYFQICGPTGPNPSTSSAGPSPTGGTGSGPAGLPATTPSCVRKCASIKVREGYCYSSQVFMAAFFQCLSDNCNSNDAATGRRLTYLQLCSVTGPNPPSSPAGPLPTGGTGSGTGGLPANTPSCASRCASIKVREGYCYSSQIMMTAFFQCLSDNCNSIDAAKGRQLTYRQICGSTGPNPSSPSAGPSPTGGAGSNTGGLPAATPSCARKCATIKVTEGYCFSSQIFTTAFFRCLSDNCNSIDAAKGRQLTYSQICGSTDPNPSSSSAGPSPTGGAGAGTGGLPPATPSCARKCAAIKVTEGYCSSSQIFMTAFFQCLSDNCKSEDAAKGRSITYIQICGSLGGGGGTPITSSTAPIPTGNPGPGSTALNNAPACVKKCARVKVSEGYCYSAEAFTISYHRCLRDNCDRDGVREGLRIGSREICPSSSTGSPTDSSASTRPTNVPTDSNAALNKAPDCVKTCARVKVSEGYCYSAEAFTVSYHRCLRDNCNRDAVREGQRLGYNEICPSRNPDRPLQPPESGSSNTTNPGASSGQIPSTAPRCVRNCAQTKIREGYCTSPIIFSSSYLRCLTDNCNSQNLAIGRQFTYVQICGSSGNTGSVVQPGNPPPITSPTDPTGNKTGTGHVPSTAPRCVMNCARIKVQEGYCASPVTFTKAFSQCLRTNCNQADADAGAKLTHKQICGPNDASESGKPPCDCGRNSSSPSNPTTVERRSVRHAPRQFVL